MGRINLLKGEFPEAKFIFIHRDPVEAIQSAKKLWKLNKTFSYEEYSESQVERILIKQYQEFYNSFMSESANIEYIDVKFKELITDSLDIIEFIYKRTGLAGWEKSKPDINNIIQKRTTNDGTLTKYQTNSILNDDQILKIRTELGYVPLNET